MLIFLYLVQIMKGLEFAQKIDSSIPDEYKVEFGKIAPTFLEPFCSFMREVRGPAYQPPKFENVQLSEKPKETPLGGIVEQDIISITQPSQHVSQDPMDIDALSSSRPEKLDVRRVTERKWQINKAVKVGKKDEIKFNWGWGDGMVKKKGGICHKRFHLNEEAMLSLAPGSWIDDRVIYTYMV